MNNVISNGSASLDTQSDFVRLWRLAIQGDAAARRAFQQRIGLQDTMSTGSLSVGFVPLPVSQAEVSGGD